MRHVDQAWGLDNDAAMLEFLCRQLRREGRENALVFQGDLAAFHLAVKFSLILLPCNTLSTLPPATRRAAFACARRHLRPGGVFAASLPNPALLKRLPRRSPAQVEETILHPGDGEPVQVSSAWERSEDLFTVTWHYDHLLPDGRVERLTARAGHHLAPVSTYLAELEEAGLEVAEQYGDFDRSPYHPGAPSWIILASAS
jgi:SAM-dependent methyltransferase